MTQRYLVAVSFGQVQSFIDAARRTRDLWAGSNLLSEMARECAEALKQSEVDVIIFPSEEALKSASSGGIGNKVLAELHTDDPGALLDAVRIQVQARLVDEAESCLVAIRRMKLLDAVGVAGFNEQLSDLLDLVWAWAPWPEGTPYSTAFNRVQVLLDARKRTRTFAQVNGNTAATFERDDRGRKLRSSSPMLSSLDGRHETVLLEGAALNRLRQRYQINLNEELDALGLIKRVSARGEGFPSITRVALQPWVRRLTAPIKEQLSIQLEALKADDIDLCRGYRVSKEFVFTEASGTISAVPNPFVDFSFDCEILLPSRRRLLSAELLTGNAALKEIGKLLKQEEAAIKEDGLYVCALVADGDHMGEILQDGSLTLKEHQALSAALARYASNCHGLAARHDSACIYAGGDDVLALCPVDSALALARELADAFARDLRAAMPAGLLERRSPSLSVGLAFAHVMHPLSDLRELAKQANKLAKLGADAQGLRNALGVIVAPRSGAPVQVVGQWPEADDSGTVRGLDGRLALWRDAFTKGQLSRSAGYDLARLARATGVRALRAEALRLFGRRLDPAASGILQALLTPPKDAPQGTAAYEHLAAEWYVGRWLSLHSVGGSAGSPGAPASEHME